MTKCVPGRNAKQRLAETDFFFPKAGLTAKRTLHDSKWPAGRSTSESGRGRAILSATDLGGRVPRLRDVPDDGGGTAVLSRSDGHARKRVLEIPVPSPKSRGMDRLLAPR